MNMRLTATHPYRRLPPPFLSVRGHAIYLIPACHRTSPHCPAATTCLFSPARRALSILRDGGGRRSQFAGRLTICGISCDRRRRTNGEPRGRSRTRSPPLAPGNLAAALHLRRATPLPRPKASRACSSKRGRRTPLLSLQCRSYSYNSPINSAW